MLFIVTIYPETGPSDDLTTGFPVFADSWEEAVATAVADAGAGWIVDPWPPWMPRPQAEF